MTTYERAIKQGRWLLSRRKLLPAAVAVACVVAILVSTPFLLIHDRIWLAVLSLAVAFAGIALRAAAYVPPLGPEPCDRPLYTTGIYSVMRFPRIAANLLLAFSVIMFTGSMWFMIAAAMILYFCTYCVIFAMEHSLQSRYGEEFLQWCKTTYAITPHLLNWQPGPKGPSAVRLLLDQAPVAAAVLGGFCVIDLLKHLVVDFSFRIDVPWIAAFIVALLLVLFLRRK